MAQLLLPNYLIISEIVINLDKEQSPMDQFDSSLDKEYESLNEAIMKALITSKDVKQVLEDFKSKELINNLSVLNLVLSLEELSQLVFSEDHDFDIDESVAERPAAPKKAQKATPPSPYVIDGKRLSKNEILFQKYCQALFDEEEWAKKARVKI